MRGLQVLRFPETTTGQRFENRCAFCGKPIRTLTKFVVQEPIKRGLVLELDQCDACWIEASERMCKVLESYWWPGADEWYATKQDFISLFESLRYWYNRLFRGVEECQKHYRKSKPSLG